MFFDEKLVIKNDVSDFCETNNSSFSSLNKSCVKTIEIKEEKEKRKHFDFESFVIDFVLSCYHVSEIENLRSVVVLMKKSRKYQKINVKKKKKKRMTFETFNQYRENRSISNESDIDFAKRELSKSSSHQKKTTFVSNKFEQFRSSTTMTFLQALQMLLR
jgi:tRNA uridine 5-carbamoylmethylation protein Kti12